MYIASIYKKYPRLYCSFNSSLSYVQKLIFTEVPENLQNKIIKSETIQNEIVPNETVRNPY